MIWVAVLLTSCHSSEERTLELSDKMLMVNPERALAILDSLENTGGLNKEEQLHLVWNRAMAHKVLGMSLAEDEQLPHAIAFYRNEPDKQADSYLLEASYLDWTGKRADAINVLNKGIAEITDSTKRVRLMAAQAGLLERQQAYESATEVLKKALEYNSSQREEAILNYKIGLNLSLMGHPQSEYFYDRSVRIAAENGDTAMASEARLEAKGYSDIARRVVIELERCILDYEDGKHVSYVDFARYCDSITADMLDGRKVNDLQELSTLLSDNIRNVEVISNPGSSYAADTKAVIRIRTKKASGRWMERYIQINRRISALFPKCQSDESEIPDR